MMNDDIWSALKTLINWLWVPLGVIMSYVVKKYQESKKEQEDSIKDLNKKYIDHDKKLAVHTTILEMMDKNIQDIKDGVKQLLNRRK